MSKQHAVGWWQFSTDGRLTLLARTRARTNTHLRADLPDRLEHVKFSGLTWTHDGLGFFYCGYEPPSTSDAGTEVDKNVNQQLRYHVLGTSQDEDRTVLAIPEEPTWMLGSEVTNDGRLVCAARRLQVRSGR